MPIAYLSTQVSDTQFKLSTVVKEGYAIYYCVKKWRHYLEDANILLKSDAKSLNKFFEGRTENNKLDRWSLELQGRDIQVSLPLELKGQLKRLILVSVQQDQELQVPGIPEGAGGRWWQMGCGRLSWQEVGLRTWRNVTLLPSGAHKNLPPLSLLLPPPSFLNHKPPSIELPSPTSGPLPKPLKDKKVVQG